MVSDDAEFLRLYFWQSKIKWEKRDREIVLRIRHKIKFIDSYEFSHWYESNIPYEKWFVELRVSKVWLCQIERLIAFEVIFFLEILRCMRNQFRWLMWSQRLKSNHFIVE